MIRVLFVDDEQDILDGLQNRLRRKRRQWKMSFANGGAAALAHLEQHPCDVMVTDMRMPGMDGTELLMAVRDRHPQMVRIVLSGQTDKEQVLRSLPWAHQFLSKPCDAEVLERAIERARILQATLSNAALQAEVARLDRMTPLPPLYRELTEALEGPEGTLDRVVEMLESHPRTAATILELIRSALGDLVGEVTSIRDAVTHLGLSPVRSLVLSIALLETLECGRTVPGFSRATMQGHALEVAHIAARLVPDPHQLATAFSAAMLHDIGSLVLATTHPEYYAPSFETARAEGLSLHDAELRCFGFSHAEVGGALLSRWGLPFPVVEAVTFHHRPHLSVERELGVVGAVHIADRLGHHPPRAGDDRCALDCEYVERTGIGDDVPDWRAAFPMAGRAEHQGVNP